MWLFLIIGAGNKDIKSKRKFLDNHDHNILRVVDILPSFVLTTSKTKRD